TFGEMKQIDPKFLLTHDRDAVAKTCGLSLADFEPDLPIETVSTGVPFTIVPIRALETLSRLRVDHARTEEYRAEVGGGLFYFVCRQTVDPNAGLHTRLMFSGGEDPATGSAAGCAASWMVAHGVAQPDVQVVIEQGIEIKRPSRIFVRASKQDNRVVNVRVGGNAVEVMRGEMTL